jgi:PAS domain S-box-containing protein
LTFRAIKIRDQKFLLILVEDLSLEKKQILLDRKYKEDLEKRVKERTEQLRRLNEELLSEIADRKRSEEALSRSEERFRQIAENAGEWTWEVDAEGMYRYSSSAVESILGYSPAELVGHKHFYDLFAPEVREELKEVALAAFGRKEPFQNFVNPNVHKNGEIRFLETSGSPILDSEGNLLGYLGVDKDITDRKEIEEALRTSEAQLSNALTMAHLGHWEYDVTKDLFTFNDHLYKIFRTTSEQVGGYTMSSADYAGRFVHPEDISVVADETRKAIETSDPLFSR